MVQKKIPSKLGIQVGHVKSDKHLAKLKPSPSQYQDGKNRTAEMKKMKSRSIKLSDLQGYKSSSSSSLRRNISQPGKPPPLRVTASATGSLQKQQPLIRAADGSPNYMKSTSSSNAKKELSLVSVRNTQSGSICNKRWKNKLRNPTLDSVTKPAKDLIKSSSLKKVRNLTKTPSFKLTRGQWIKTSTVAMSEDISLQKATCSSTLKDSKFPEYLIMLSTGGNEYEGTSVVKVCPYNYCSLNGHYHTPSPPLKSYLSAKRRALKTLKSFKLETRSPRRVKVTKKIKKASDIEQNSFDESPAYDEVDVGCSDISSSTGDDETDFFIQIYAKDHKEEAIKTWSQGDEIGESDPAGELKDQHDINSINGKQIISVDGEEDIMQVVASVSDGSPKSEIDLEEDFDQKHVDIEAETETKRNLVEDETTSEDWRDNTAECSQATDMEWEEGYFSFIQLSYEGNIPNPNGNSHDSNLGCLLEVYCPCSHDAHTMLTEGLNSIDNKKNIGSVSVQEASLEDVGAQFDGDDVEPEGISLKTQPVTYGEAKTLTFDQLSLSEYSFPDLSDSEDSREEVITLASNLAQETSREFKEGNDETPKDEVQVAGSLVRHVNGMECDRTQALDEVLNDERDRKRLEDDGTIKCFNDSMSNTSQPQVKSKEERRNETFEAPEEFPGAVNDTSIEVEELQDIHAGVEAKKEDSAESEVCSAGIQNHAKSDTAESAAEIDNIISADKKNTLLPARTDTSREVSDIFCNWKQLRRGTRPESHEEELKKFNPRAPNYLSLVADPEAEKIDLKHQEMDERRNAAEWMIDYALQRAVTKLASARKRKVALLVEAFETVNPIPKYESHLRNTSAFTHHRLMQTCS